MMFNYALRRERYERLVQCSRAQSQIECLVAMGAMSRGQDLQIYHIFIFNVDIDQCEHDPYSQWACESHTHVRLISDPPQIDFKPRLVYERTATNQGN